MNQLDRLVELVNRTQLPTVVQSSDAQASCVVVPFVLYERLSQGISVQTEPPRSAPALTEVPIPPSEPSIVPDPPKTSLSLQDLLHTSSPISSPTGSIQPNPQIEALDDRFAFDGDEVKILPQMKQKSGLGNPAIDPFGPTLA